jgi:signal transduction histidine kinase
VRLVRPGAEDPLVEPAEEPHGRRWLGGRERVELLGGSMRVESSTGAGTTLAVEVPLP